jgi:hypothetical protein
MSGPNADVPWFAGREGTLLVYRVNRRPKYSDTLFPSDMPEDVFEHFVRMLAPGYEVVSGRANQRIWKVGGLAVDEEARTLTGKLGWQPREEEPVSEWSEDEMDWISGTAAPTERKLLPFGFDGDSRLLTVLADGSSAASTIAAVFEKILRNNEEELERPTTEWSVEPILDRRDFLSWLNRAQVVTSVSFTARLPNPESKADFEDLWRRLQDSHATAHTETMRSSREEGLQQVAEDRDFSQAIAMGQEGFATLRGKGYRDGVKTTYSQKEAVAADVVEELPYSWNDMRAFLTEKLKSSLRRFTETDRKAA